MEALAVIRTKLNEIWIDDEGILILKPDDGIEIDQEEVEACFKAYQSLGIGPKNKVLEIIDARGNNTLTPEARTLAAKMGKDYFIASAIISESLSIRLIVNFFNKFYKQDVPFKMFANEKSAREWLRTFRK